MTSITTGTITAARVLLGRYGETMATDQVGLLCPATKVIPSEKIDDMFVHINVDTGTNSSTEWVADGGATADGAVSSMEQGYQTLVAIRNAVKLGRIVTHVAKGKKGINYFKKQAQNATRHIAQRYGRALFGAKVMSSMGTETGGGTDFTTTDPSGFRVGASYDIMNGASLVESFTVTGIDSTDGVTYTITHAARAQTWTGYDVYQAGGYADAVPSLQDMCDGNVTLHNLTTDENDWTPNAIASVGTLNQADVRALHTMIKRKTQEKCTHMLLNSENEGRLIADLNDQGRFMVTGNKSIDSYGFVLQVDGLPAVVDENCSDADVFLINSNNLTQVKAKEIGPVIDGATAKGSPLAAVHVVDGTLDYKAYFEGYCTFITDRRNAHGRLAGITG